MARRIALVATSLAALLLPPWPAAVPAPPSGALADLRPIPSPAASGSAEPHLTVGPDGRVWLSWLEPRRRGGHALRGSRLEGERWSRAFTIAEGDSFFANWADFPMLLAREGDHLVAAYLWKVPGGTYAYQVRLVQSRDGGRTWSPAVVPHRDDTPTEHGFVSLVATPEGTRVVWLDGRNAVRDSAGHMLPVPEGSADMTLRTVVLGADGSLVDDAELDARVCDCCQTAVVAVKAGALVAYRDRDADEIRDIKLVRLRSGRVSRPYPLHDDGWKIAGCPVNGPALDAAREGVVAAWYTAAQDTPRVWVAFSGNDGRSFSAPTRVDGGAPLGRVHAALLEDGDALVTWLEVQGKEALVQVRRVGSDGAPGATTTVARTAAARASGFPRLVRSGDRVVLAWTEAGKPSRVRTALARVAPAVAR